MNSNDIKPLIIPAAIAVGIFMFGNKILEFLQLKDTKEETQAANDAAALGKASYWSQSFLKPGAKILTASSGNTLSKQIYDAIGYITDDEASIMAVFNALNYKTQVTSLAYYYNKNYQQDLYFHLKQNLNESEMQQIKQIIDNKPTGQ